MIQFKNGDQIVLADTNEHELINTSPAKGNYDHFTATIEIIKTTGNGMTFSSGEPISVIAHPWIQEDKLIMTWFPVTNNLRVKAATIGDAFVITF